MQKKSNFETTVIVRTKNSEKIFGQTLKALFSQNYLDFKLLVIDSGSTDKTIEIAKYYNAEIISIAAADYYPGKILNAAIKETSSEMIIFLNSDTVLLTPLCLSSLLAPFHDLKVQATFARQLPRPDAETWVIRDYQTSFPNSETPPHWMFLSLPFAAIRKSIWEKHPFYTEAWGSEDTEWGYWAKMQNMTIKYVPEAIVMHSHNYTFKQLYGRRFIEGEADAFIFKNNYGFISMLLDYFKACLRDLLFYIKSNDWFGMPKIPLLRFVYYWAYYKGHRLGKKRQKKGDQNTSLGQKEILKRYD